jgi:multicomponent Na+:H+ antiporter subunit E
VSAVIKSLCARIFALVLLWWALSEGLPFELGLPVLSVLAAASVSLWLLPPGQPRWRLAGAIGFVPYFILQSLLGGIDVAWRSLHPALPVHPGFVEYQLRLRHESARVFFVLVMSLLPGTAVAGWDNGRITIHALDTELAISHKAGELEERVAALFGCDLTP